MPTKFTDTKEFYELVKDFERIFSTERLDREAKEMNSKGAFYQSGETNKLFKAFMNGYQVGRAVYM
jgi:hypothetical protein